jgi:hypothetical protein
LENFRSKKMKDYVMDDNVFWDSLLNRKFDEDCQKYIRHFIWERQSLSEKIK